MVIEPVDCPKQITFVASSVKVGGVHAEEVVKLYVEQPLANTLPFLGITFQV
jgi:hypothetical protein